MLCARDPQAVYDLNFAAVKIGEHLDVRLPVIVAYDGFFTSHQKRRIQVFDDPNAIRRFLGERPDFPSPLDTEHPATFGPYMNDPDLINNKVQLSQAMEAARRVIPEVFAELEKMTGRSYPMLDAYRMEDAEAALVLLNSAAETAKEAADELRAKGQRVGVLSPNVLRPFPAEEFRRALQRRESRDRSAIARIPMARAGATCRSRCAPRSRPTRTTTPWSCRASMVSGARIFTPTDAEQLFEHALEAANPAALREPFAYHGATPGRPGRQRAARATADTRRRALARHGAGASRRGEQTSSKVELEPLWKMTAVPSRIAPGHGACPGCGAFPMLHQVYNVLEGDVVVLFQTGCAMVVTSGYPATAHRINYVHNLFQNGAATLSGLVEMYHERVRRGELPASKDITFVMITGDGGMDIGMGSGDRRGEPQPPHDDPGVRQPGLYEQRRAALMRDAVRSPHLGERGREWPAGETLPPQGHRADLRRVPSAVRVYRERGLSRGSDAQGRKGPVVRQERGAGLWQHTLLLPAQLAHGRTTPRSRCCRRRSTAASSRSTRSSTVIRRSPTTRTPPIAGVRCRTG